ncbi:MAG: aspartyl-trna synthetase [Pararhodobacter sp.]|nr:aspartyl-trna synthetase [Pararhodobacter sp.]
MTRCGWTALAAALALVIGMSAGPGGMAPPAHATTPERGPETGLPLPRFVSLKSGEGRARRGPNSSHRVDWIYTRRDVPLRVTAEFEHWRRVEDFEGQGGWMHYSLLSGIRTALVVGDMVPMRSQPRANATEVAILERGVIARIMSCDAQWCRLRAETQRGWVDRAALWGLDPDEVLD